VKSTAPGERGKGTSTSGLEHHFKTPSVSKNASSHTMDFIPPKMKYRYFEHIKKLYCCCGRFVQILVKSRASEEFFPVSSILKKHQTRKVPFEKKNKLSCSTQMLIFTRYVIAVSIGFVNVMSLFNMLKCSNF